MNDGTAGAIDPASAGVHVALSAPGLLRLLRLTSAALPVGAFAYSHGLESAVTAGWVHDRATARAWVEGVLRNAIAACDVPAFARLYAAFERDDLATVRQWNAWLFATRATSELQEEDRQLASALARLLVAMGNPRASAWAGHPATTFCTVFALAAQAAGISPLAAALGYACAWTETQVGAAVRLVPLGQTDGQLVLAALEPAIVEATVLGLGLEDDDISGTVPGHALASALHETQYSRLFRS